MLQALENPDKKIQEKLAGISQGGDIPSTISFDSSVTISDNKNKAALRTYVGSLKKIQRRGNIAEGIFHLQKFGDSLTSLRYAMRGQIKITPAIHPEMSSMYLALNYAEQPSLILKLSPKVGDEWTGIAHGASEGIEGNTVVESTTEKIEVPAGIFEDCLKVKTTITGGVTEGNLLPRDAFIRGTRTMYFAPGVGLIKLEYQHEVGHRTEIILVDYATQNDISYFPLDVDNTWTYRG